MSHAFVELRAPKAGGVNPRVSVLVHLCGTDDWRLAQARGEHRPHSLDVTGFVHLSTPEQVHLPANRLYAGRTDQVLLTSIPHDCPLRSVGSRWEPAVPTDPDAIVFPHLCGPLPAAAVRIVTPYRPDAEGRFAPLADQDST